MCCISLALSTVANALRISVLILLLIQMAFGIGLTFMGYWIFMEAAPDKPDSLKSAGQFEAAISLFHYAGEVKQFTDSSLAKSCVMLMVTGVLLAGFGMLGFTSVASSRPRFLLIFLAALVLSSTITNFISTRISTYKETSIDALNDLMTWTITTQYDGNINSTNRWSRFWDLGHVTKSGNFGKVYLGPEFGLESYPPGLYEVAIPPSCCKVADDYGLDVFATIKSGQLKERGGFVLLNESCLQAPNAANSYSHVGCRASLEGLVLRYSRILYAFSNTSVGFTVFLQLGIILIIYSII